MVGLDKQGLIGHYRYSFEAKDFSDVNEPGLLVTPSTLGVELFLSAYGLADLHPIQLLDASTKIHTLEGINFDTSNCKIM
jgi:hypothetical protein